MPYNSSPQQQPYYHPTHPPSRAGGRRGAGPKRPHPSPPVSPAPYSAQMAGNPQGQGYYSYPSFYQPVGFPDGSRAWGVYGAERGPSVLPFEAPAQMPPATRTASSAASEPEQPWSPSSTASATSHNREKKAIPLVDPKTGKSIAGDRGRAAACVTDFLGYRHSPLTSCIFQAFGRPLRTLVGRYPQSQTGFAVNCS